MMILARSLFRGSRIIQHIPNGTRTDAVSRRLQILFVTPVSNLHNASSVLSIVSIPIQKLARYVPLSSINCFSTVAKADADRKNAICWKCRAALSSVSKFFCEHCRVALPPANFTKFQVLDLAEDFNISIVELQKAFKDLQRIFHPDKFTLRSDTEKQISELISSLINVSYTTLLDPLKRGVYLLKLKGIKISEETQLSDPEFLMEVMELNEKIAASEDTKNLIEIQETLHKVCDGLITEISEAFEIKNLDAAKSLLIKLRYYNNMVDKLKHMIPPS